MPFHVPFEYRRQMPPIYIGFDRPQPRRVPWNWCGMWGFGLGFCGIMTAGLLSPIALLLSLVGLRRPNRRLAKVGTVLGLVGTMMLSGIIFAGVSHDRQVRTRHQRSVESREYKRNIEKTKAVLAEALNEFAEYRDVNQGNLPAWIDANMVALKYEDAWGQSIRFDAEHNFANLRSAGRDKQFDTADDIVVRVEGKTDRATLLPIEVAEKPEE